MNSLDVSNASYGELSPAQLRVLALREITERAKKRRLFEYYPDEGPLRRELYPRHTTFFALGLTHSIRAVIAANRIGKTEGIGGYEVTLHLTGRYPAWWVGRRFDRPVRAWVAGDTAKTVRDILQTKLLGPVGAFGTGLIPGDDLLRTTAKAGVADAIENAYIQHASGGESVLQFKSYDQGRQAFQGTEQDIIWLDEESEEGIRSECLTRLLTTGGMLIETFTPLKGLTPLVKNYLPNGFDGEHREVESEGKALVMAGWDDVPHLSEEAKALLLRETPPYLREARSKGIPSLGSGAIYPIVESEFVIKPFDLPEHWPRVYAMDVGWNRTAVVWGALDRESQTLYLYSEHYQGHAEPSVHAEAIRARGDWIPGVLDPAARGRAQRDGEQLLQNYTDLGLNLTSAKNAVEAGIYAVWQRLAGGRLKVFNTMQHFRDEYRIYRRDEKGHIVKADDHLMDATRYLVMSGLDVASVKHARSFGPKPGEFC
jgi:phage terminase large subunit-like protein